MDEKTEELGLMKMSNSGTPKGTSKKVKRCYGMGGNTCKSHI